MNAKKIIQDYLRKNGYDGLLCTDIPCGCSIDELMPCGENCNVLDCEPAYAHPCTGEACTHKCEGYDPENKEQRCFRLAKPENAHKRPKVITLCGSTRFTREMLVLQWKLTKQGNIVLSWCAVPDDYYKGPDKTHIGDQEGVKDIVDEVHKRKIDLSDEIQVLNIGGYIGSSTRSEIEYAIERGVPVKYMEALDAP